MKNLDEIPILDPKPELAAEPAAEPTPKVATEATPKPATEATRPKHKKSK